MLPTWLSPSLVAGMAIATLASLVVTSGQAEAQRRQYQEWRYETDRPVRGYEGSAFPNYYCSYIRTPRRVCKFERGREKCRVVGWTLQQHCS